MRAHHPRMRRSRGCETQHFHRIPRAIGMMREPRRRNARPRTKNFQHLGVQALLLCLRQRIFQCAPCEIVTERE